MVKVNKYFFPYIIFLLFLGFKGQLILAFLIVLFHESIHYITALALGFSGFDIEVLPIGARLSLKDLDEASPKEDIIISLSAPLFNIAAAVLSRYLYMKYKYDYIYILYIGNLTIGLFNLLPALPLDGGRVLRSLLSLKTIYKKANAQTIKFSIILGILMSISYAVMLFLGKNNISIGVIAGFIIYSSLKEKERIVYIIMGDIVRKRYKFLKAGYIENKTMSIHFKKDLITALSIVDRNKYNIFTILDDEMKVMDIIYEEELIEALKIYGNLTIEEFINMKE